VNDATSVVLFNALQNFDLNHIDVAVVLKFLGNFFYLFVSSTLLGVFVSYFFSIIYFYFYKLHSVTGHL
jgi:NhaP-type Na+/H+ or K+/H+ antiporter